MAKKKPKPDWLTYDPKVIEDRLQSLIAGAFLEAAARVADRGGSETECEQECAAAVERIANDPAVRMNLEAEEDSRRTKKRAAEVAAGFLRAALVERAKDLLRPGPMTDDWIAGVESILRAARRVGAGHVELRGEPVPSIRLPSGSTITLVEWLVETMGTDKMAIAGEWEECDSRSKANIAIWVAREAARAGAREVLKEGTIIA